MTSLPNGDEVLNAALRYAEFSISVVPIRAGTKKAAVKWTPYQMSRADEDQIRKWFGNGRSYGVAIILGTVSGQLVCRDFDEMAAYRAWATAHPELAKTLPTVKSSRGRHVYFRADIAVIRSHSKSGGCIIKFPDGELRGDGAYCVAPPSLHPDGDRYEWLIPLNGDVPFVDLFEAGFLSACNREGGVHRETERAECTEVPERTETTESPERSGRSESPETPERTERPETPETCLRFSVCTPPSLLHDIEDAIERTQPNGMRQRHHLLFDFARELKAIPALADADVRSLKSFVRQWYDCAQAFITSPFEETWFDFAEAWDKVRFPVGKGPIEMAFQTVSDTDLPAVAEQYEQKDLRLLVGLCRELQRTAGGEQPFFLACRTAARLLHMDHSTVSRWLRGLQVDGILKLVDRGCQKDRKASRYLYLPDDL